MTLYLSNTSLHEEIRITTFLHFFSTIGHNTPTMKQLLYILTTLLCFCGAGCISDKQESPDKTTLVTVGDLAPDFEVELTDGEKIRLSELQGKIVLLTLWDPECPTCRTEMMAVEERIINRLQDEDFIYLPIARGCNIPQVMAFLQAHNLNFAAGADPNRVIYSLYATLYVPRSFIIDPQGVIRHSAVEYKLSHLDKMAEIIEALR